MKHYIYHIPTNTVIVCSDFQELIQWFARYNYANFYQNISNSMLGEISLNFNDKKVSYRWDDYEKTYVPRLVPREIVVWDEKDRIIDIRLYKEDILKASPGNRHRKQNRKETYVFRNGPVPQLCSKTKQRRKMFRHPHTTNERSQSSNPDIKPYIRPKRRHKNLVHSWDEIPRHNDKSWKNKKIKRQWMKHLK